VALPRLHGEVAFRDMSFAYRADRPAGRRVVRRRRRRDPALVGPTGAGKSTVMALLLRLFDPDAGAIPLDDLDLRRARRRPAPRGRDRAARNVLFATSVRENIRYAAPARATPGARRRANRLRRRVHRGAPRTTRPISASAARSLRPASASA
jgi:ABC-type multidrug transport system fused ATPase/permease subunit